jgi:Mid2 like cell wall stress sensor
MRTLSILILTAILVADQVRAQQPAADSSIRQEIAGMPTTSLVQVNLNDGHRLRGRIVSRTDSDFSLQREKGAGAQTIAYDQVLSVSQVKGGHSHKTRWIIVGVVVGLGVAVAVIAIVVVYGLSHNG